MRLIDADKLKSVFNYLCGQKNVGTITLEAVEAIIDTAPTVNQWIPCSERMPELREDVLICLTSGEFVVSFLDKDFHGKTFWAYGLNSNDIVAWMPIPEPYKEADI